MNQENRTAIIGIVCATLVGIATGSLSAFFATVFFLAYIKNVLQK
jgi:hypothetical protein